MRFTIIFSKSGIVFTMGCCMSYHETTSGIGQTYIDIPLLSKPRKTFQSDQDSAYFSLTSYDMYTPDRTDFKRKNSVEADMIDHTKYEATLSPDLETTKQQEFSECFSHIEASTFQNIPMFSVQSHRSYVNFDDQIFTSDYDDYSNFMDQVLGNLITPLYEMKINDNRNLSISVSV